MFSIVVFSMDLFFTAIVCNAVVGIVTFKSNKVIEPLSSLLITVYRSLFDIGNWRNNEIFSVTQEYP